MYAFMYLCVYIYACVMYMFVLFVKVWLHIIFEEWTTECFSKLLLGWDWRVVFLPDYTSETAFGLNLYNPAGSTTSSTSDHWLIRLAGASERGSVVSAEPILGTSIIETPESAEFPVFGDETLTATETSRCCKYLWWGCIKIQFINHNTMQMVLVALVIWKLLNGPCCVLIFNYSYINCTYIDWCVFILFLFHQVDIY